MSGDREFIAAFEACRLPPTAFRHRDHIRLAWLYLRNSDLPTAMQSFAVGLRRYAASLGKDGLYHETITFAFLVAVNERMARGSADADWETFCAANPDLFLYPSPLLARLYRPETLKSDLARRTFVLPDNVIEEAAVP